MSLARYDETLVDEAGNVVSNAIIEVRRETPGSTLATLFSDREGTAPIANPIVVTPADDGAFGFHVIGGPYRIRDLTPGSGLDRRYVGIGTGSEIDANAFLSAGWQYQVEGDNTAPPSAGCVRFDVDDLSLATKAWFDYSTSAGSPIPGIIQELDPGAKATLNTLILVNQADGTQASWQVSAVIDHTTYKEVQFAASSHQGATAFDSATPVNLQREISGDVAGSGGVIYKTTSGNVTVGDTDGTVILNKSAPSATGITLPPVADRNNLPLKIVDYGGNAGDITITPDGTEKIMGLSSATLVSNGQGVGLAAVITLYPDTTLGGWTQ